MVNVTSPLDPPTKVRFYPPKITSIWRRVLDKPTVVQLVEKFAELWGIATSLLYSQVSATDPVQRQMNPLLILPTIVSKSIIPLFSHLCLYCQSGLLPSSFVDITLVLYIPLPSHTWYMSCFSHAPWFNHPTTICWKVQITKRLIMQFIPVSPCFLLLGATMYNGDRKSVMLNHTK